MKIRLWQLFALNTWISAILGSLFAYGLPIVGRIGVSLVLTGLLLTVGRPLMPRPPRRTCIDNEATLEKWNDALFFGIPALFVLIVGFSLLFWNFIFGCACAIIFMVVYLNVLFTR